MGLDVAAVLNAARAHGLLAGGRPVVVLLSGGRDSVCLIDVAVRLAGRDAVRALHVDYGLRAASGEDARHCAALCDALGVALSVERPAPRASGNLQAWARERRYEAARRDAAADGALIATGHTSTDQVETVLYRLASSPGRRALLGMAASDGSLIRPLLSVTREQTAAYCRARNLAWRDDSSNLDRRFARNRVRHGLSAALREIHPAAERNVLRTAELLRDEAAVLDELVDGELSGSGAIEQARLAALPPALRRLVVRRLAEEAAGRPVPGAPDRAGELLALASGGGSASLDLGSGVRAVVEYGVLRVVGVANDEPPATARLPVPGRARFGAWEVCSERVPPRRVDGTLDATAIGDELLVRAWRPGDRMAPLGLGGTKALGDLFTDRRVPRAQRAVLPIVEVGGEIAWIPGVATSARFRVTEETTDAVRLSARRLRTGP